MRLAKSHKIATGQPAADKKLAFEHVVIDAERPAGSLAEIGRRSQWRRPPRSDRRAGTRSGGLVWYENPTWKKHVVPSEGSFSTDGEAADVDGDGDNDLVVLKPKELLWYENPGWAAHHIDDMVLHDIEVADLDGDGRPRYRRPRSGRLLGPQGDAAPHLQAGIAFEVDASHRRRFPTARDFWSPTSTATGVLTR